MSKPRPPMPSQPMVHGKVVVQDSLPVKKPSMPKGGKPPSFPKKAR